MRLSNDSTYGLYSVVVQLYAHARYALRVQVWLRGRGRLALGTRVRVAARSLLARDVHGGLPLLAHVAPQPPADARRGEEGRGSEWKVG